MKEENEIKDKLLELESDERLSYPPAIVQINAPLALIQTEIEAKVRILKWVLNYKP